MAKVEEVVTERWRLEHAAKKLDGEIQQLKVAMNELDNVRPKKATFVKRANVFFMERRDVIVKTKRTELKDKEQKRLDVGMQLRSAQ
ncbi:hypothetical protein Poli38472_000718 [Pythium oligandrum]|uniref:Uncharacterized protein n=1 Tax=Pythium oligandrum TaxID=41045 RepID=A0A8K1FFL3_PYTOL|nr:hypothetical protein Poli38472_000718 [Pythium oligandrum]|eukprot:TMW60676.1 hypothetical protein Poli38472_000718 [Pythium oligandrum]